MIGLLRLLLTRPGRAPEILRAMKRRRITEQRPHESGHCWFYVNERHGRNQKGVMYPTPRWADEQSRLSRPYGFRPLYRVHVIPKPTPTAAGLADGGGA